MSFVSFYILKSLYDSIIINAIMPMQVIHFSKKAIMSHDGFIKILSEKPVLLLQNIMKPSN